MPTGQSTTTTITVSLPDVDYFLTEYWGHENLTSVDAATGAYFADAEKSTAITSDDNSCWLAAGCNILHWSGWAAAGDSSMTSEDALFSYANRCWGYNDGGYALDAFTWWVSGMSTFPTVTAPSGGDKFPEVLYSSDMAATVSFIGLNAVYSLANMLEMGLGVSLSIRSTYISHALTCWGYRVEDGRVYLYYSDSDDNQTRDPATAPNELWCSELTYRQATRRWYLSDYKYSSNVYVASVTYMVQYDPILSGNHETVADARTLTASGDPGDTSFRRGKFDAANDDDYYKLTGEGRGASFYVTMLSGSGTFTTEFLNADGESLGEPLPASSHSGGSYTTSEEGECYYLILRGSPQSGTDLTDIENVYQITIINNRWFANWTALEGEASEIVNVALDATAATQYLGDDPDFLDGDSVKAALVGTGDGGYRTVYGGSMVGPIAGDIRIWLDDTTIRTLYGGGASGTYVSGDVVIEMNEKTTVKSLVYGGGRSHVMGNVYINLDSARGPGNLYGGSLNGSVVGSTNLTVNAGEYTGIIYGGGRGADGNASQSGAVNVTIQGEVTHANNAKLLHSGESAWLVGGGAATAGSEVSAGDVAITVGGGASVNHVVGGGQASGENAVSTTGSTAVTVTNATVNGNIYGGGYATAGGSATVTWDTSVTIDAGTENMLYIFGNIYGGGANPNHYAAGGSSTVLGGSTVTFSGSGDLLNFYGAVSGDGAVRGTVAGTRKLVFSGYSGEFSGNIANFDVISVKNCANLALNGGCRAETLELTIADPTADGALLTAEELEIQQLNLILDKESLGNGNWSLELLECRDASGLPDLAANLYDADENFLGTATIATTCVTDDGLYILENVGNKLALSFYSLS